MTYVLDGAAVLILVLFMLWGYRRGFVRTAVQTIGCVAALVVAFLLSGVISEAVYDMVIDEPLKAYASEQVANATNETMEAQINTILEDLPGWSRTVLSHMGYDSAQDMIQQWNPDSDATASDIVDHLIRPPAVAVLRLITFLIVFVLLMVVVTLLSRLAKQIFRLPLLRQADKALGIVMGAIQGLLWVFALATILQLYVSMSSTNGVITQSTLNDTAVVSVIMDWNPVTSTVQSLFVR